MTIDLIGVTSLFADPLTLYHTPPTSAPLASAFSAAGSGSFAFVCTGRSPTQSTYRYSVSATNYFDLMIGHQVGKRTRSTARLTEYILSADATDPSVNSWKSATVYFVVDVGPLGITSDMEKMYQMMSYLLYDASDAVPLVKRIVDGET